MNPNEILNQKVMLALGELYLSKIALMTELEMSKQKIADLESEISIKSTKPVE